MTTTTCTCFRTERPQRHGGRCPTSTLWGSTPWPDRCVWRVSRIRSPLSSAVITRPRQSCVVSWPTTTSASCLGRRRPEDPIFRSSLRDCLSRVRNANPCVRWHVGESGSESAVADEGAGDAGEGEEVVGLAFVASVEAAAAGEPGHGAFHGPAVAAQPLRGLDSLAGDAVGDAAFE